VSIKKPAQSGSLYCNYKQFFSIVLMALVDANYRFFYVEASFNGASSDSGVFDMTDLKEALEDGTIGLPPPAQWTKKTQKNMRSSQQIGEMKKALNFFFLRC